MREEADEWHLAKQIAAGILIAAAVIGAVYFWIQVEKARRVNAAIAEFTGVMKDMSAEHTAELKAAQAARAAQARVRAAAEQQQRVDAARRTQAAADRALQKAADADAKAKAWREFYKPARKCDNQPDWDTQIECGNAHIRAQRQFDEQWDRGELR